MMKVLSFSYVKGTASHEFLKHFNILFDKC